MLKKTIKYTDFNGVEREEDFYFNFTKAELNELEFSMPGGFQAYVERIVKAEDPVAIVKTFKEIILKSYGEKDETGKRFIKSKELSEAFSQTEAYSELYMELASNEEAASAFINAIIPKVESDKPKVIEAPGNKES